MKSSITNRNEKTSEISRINLAHYGLNMAVMKEVNPCLYWHDNSSSFNSVSFDNNILNIDFNDTHEIEFLIQTLQSFLSACKGQCVYRKEIWEDDNR